MGMPRHPLFDFEPDTEFVMEDGDVREIKGWRITAKVDIPECWVRAGTTGGFVQNPQSLGTQRVWLAQGSCVLDEAGIGNDAHIGPGVVMKERAHVEKVSAPRQFKRDRLAGIANAVLSGNIRISGRDIAVGATRGNGEKDPIRLEGGFVGDGARVRSGTDVAVKEIDLADGRICECTVYNRMGPSGISLSFAPRLGTGPKAKISLVQTFELHELTQILAAEELQSVGGPACTCDGQPVFLDSDLADLPRSFWDEVVRHAVSEGVRMSGESALESVLFWEHESGPKCSVDLFAFSSSGLARRSMQYDVGIDIRSGGLFIEPDRTWLTSQKDRFILRGQDLLTFRPMERLVSRFEASRSGSSFLDPRCLTEEARDMLLERLSERTISRPSFEPCL